MPAANDAKASAKRKRRAVTPAQLAGLNKARTEYERRSAAKAVDDPRQLARARRIVCAAIELEQLTVEELLEGVTAA